MKFLNFKSGIAALGLLIVSINGMAQSATVSFSGTVNAATCFITLSTSSGSTTSASNLSLTLPTVSTTALTLSGSTAGKTSFYMGVSGCSAGTTLTPNLYLSSSSVTGGYLVSGVTNLVFELLDSTSTTVSLTAIPVSKATFTVPTTTTTTTAYSSQFFIQYRANGAAVTATGSPTATLTVSLLYS